MVVYPHTSKELIIFEVERIPFKTMDKWAMKAT
jgi:hypothetical protein